LDKAIQLLDGVYDEYKSRGLSWADLIVLAGNTALEDAAANASVTIQIPFVGGRTDASKDDLPIPKFFEVRLNGGDQDDTVDVMKDVMLVWGLSVRELVALVAGGHSLGMMHKGRSNFADGSWTTTPWALNTEYLENLLTLGWEIMNSDTDSIQYSAKRDDQTLYMLRTDINIAVDAEFEAVAQEYLSSPDSFYQEFVNAWAKITSADMFTSSSVADEDMGTSEDQGSDEELSQGAVIAISVVLGAVVGAVIMAAVGYVFTSKINKGSRASDNTQPGILLNGIQKS
jgi:catalase-peroxidase